MTEPEKRPYFYAGHVAWTEIIIMDKDGEALRFVWDENGTHSIKRGYKEFDFPAIAEIGLTNPNGQLLKIDREGNHGSKPIRRDGTNQSRLEQERQAQ